MVAALSKVTSDGSTDDSLERSNDDIKVFLVAIAATLRETVVGFEETVTRITEITAMRPGGADRDLVVALQNFDRLQQEFVTFGEVLTRLSSLPAVDASSDKTGLQATSYDMLEGISLAGLKERLSGHLRNLKFDVPMPEGGDDEVIF